MPAPIPCLHMNHINAVVGDFDQCVARLAELYGAQFLIDMPKDEWHACLIGIGDVIFELFSPHDDLLHARFGPHYVGVEYQVADVAAAREAVGERGIRIIRELGNAFHVHPADASGVALEFFDRSFHSDPPPVPSMEAIKPIGHWRDEHPAGIAGLKRYSITVADLDIAVTFFLGLTDAAVIYEEARPAAGAKAVGLSLGDTVVELLVPDGAGEVERFLWRYGEGIRSTVFEVRDLGRVQTHLARLGVALRPGDAPESLAADPESNAGLLFEFSE